MLPGWNPLTDPIRRQARQDLERLVARLPMKRARLRRRFHSVLLQVSAQPISAVFWTLSLLAFLGAVTTAWVGWPIWGQREPDDFSGVVLAAGSATAFGSIVFSVVSSSFARASDLAPGYTVVVLGQRSPWLGGLGIICVAGLLLVYAAFDPTRAGSVAASLLAVSAITWSWGAARRALGSADPLMIARNAGNYYRRAAKRSARFASVGLANGWPKEIRRDPESVATFTRKHQWDIVVGLLRQLRAGVRSTAGQGRLTEAVMLHEALVNAFVDYAGSVEGEIGEGDGLLEVVLSGTDSVIASSLQHDDNEAGNYALRQLVIVGSQGFKDLDYAVARTFVVQKLKAYLDDAWDNDISTIPAASVVSIGELVRSWVSVHAYEDAVGGLEALGEIAARAIATRRKHIGYAATDQLAICFPILANVPHFDLRRGYLRAWSQASALVMRLAPLEPVDGMSGVADALLPGITLARSASLQPAMWEIAHDNVPMAADAIMDALETALSQLPNDVKDDRAFEHGLTDALSLAYGVALVLSRSKGAGDGKDQAERVVKMLMEATRSGPGSKAVASADVAELSWSILLAAQFSDVEDDLLTSAAETLLERLGAENDWEPPPPDEEYMLAFALGLRTVAGVPLNDLDQWEERVRARQSGGPFGSYWDWGIRIEGFGRAPSANRNRPAAPPATIDAVNDAAVERWPEFRR